MKKCPGIPFHPSSFILHPYLGSGVVSIEPLAIGVCSWSLQVKNIPELKRLLDRLGLTVVQIACGDPHHAAWDEGDGLPEAARAAGFRMTGAMLGFPGEDYTTPQTIQPIRRLRQSGARGPSGSSACNGHSSAPAPWV